MASLFKLTTADIVDAIEASIYIEFEHLIVTNEHFITTHQAFKLIIAES